MALAKTSQVAEPISIPVSVQPPDTISRLDVGGVPVSVYSFFSAPLDMNEREINKLKVITNWAKSEIGKDGTEGDMITKISQLETHLGSPSGLDKRYDKLFNYCKMTMYIREIEKKREALRRRF